jgi:hypothetical protein
MCLTGSKNGIRKALMPSKRSHQDGQKYGEKKTYLDTPGSIKFISTSSPSPPPLPHMLQLMARILNKLKKDNFSKMVLQNH